MEGMVADLPKFYIIMSYGGHWVGTGSQPLWLLALIASAFSIALWGIGQLLESLTCNVLKCPRVESASPLTGLENVNFPEEYHVAVISHLPDCEDIVSSCVEGVSSCLEGLHH
jgi:hypothetical protein